MGKLSMAEKEVFKNRKRYYTTIYEHTCVRCGDVINLSSGSRRGHKTKEGNICTPCKRGKRKKTESSLTDYEGTPV